MNSLLASTLKYRYAGVYCNKIALLACNMLTGRAIPMIQQLLLLCWWRPDCHSGAWQPE